MTVALQVVDIEQTLIGYLQGNTDLTAAGCDHVSADRDGPYPMLQVTRTGGPFDGYRDDTPAVLLQVWGAPDAADDNVCIAIMRTALALLVALPKTTLTGVAVSAVRFLTTNQRLPDGPQQRRLSSVAISAHTKP